MRRNPVEIFRELFERASQSCEEPEAMVLSTVDPDGRPSGRYVLLKSFDERGFVFFTSTASRKARGLAVNPHASLCFYWPGIEKQVRVEGPVERVSEEEADRYFATRPRESQIGAWASEQSGLLDSRATLERREAEVRARFEGQPVPRPPFWSGFRVVAQAIEFWTRAPGRLHERERSELRGKTWAHTLLYP